MTPEERRKEKIRVEALWKRRLESKKKEKEEAERLHKAREYADHHIDYWRAYDDRDIPEL